MSDRILRYADLEAMGLGSRPTIRRKVTAGIFPKPIPLGVGTDPQRRRVGWLESVVDAHLRELANSESAA